ncbi:MAG: hypothetical protein H6Q17_2014 [Bacteroidetes bacterium]|nr:hypothetical protein [Bacteroidota bacterium]
MTRLQTLFGGLSLVLLVSCGNEATRHSFCYWQRNFNMTKAEQSVLQTTGANHLYIRYFDVDWSEAHQEPKPVATLIASTAPPCNFTPSVFITNKVFERATPVAIDSLAARVARRVEMVNRRFLELAVCDSVAGNKQATAIVRNWTEILFDCDWTAATRDRYFYFLRKMEQLFPKKERSATLRLWQFKHRDVSGVPPVSRCLLMCYNLSDPKKAMTENSIGSARELESYLTRSDYPHHLDIALPVFGWGVVFLHGRWLGLLPDADLSRFRKDKLHCKEIGTNLFVLVKDTVIGTHYLRYGDEIRIEQISATELQKMIELIKKQVSLRHSSRLTLFSLDTQNVNRYGMEEIGRFYTLFDR